MHHLNSASKSRKGELQYSALIRESCHLQTNFKNLLNTPRNRTCFTLLSLSAYLIMHSKSSQNKIKKKPQWSESADELYRPGDCRLSAKLVPIFVDRGCHVVSVADPYDRILGFLHCK
jgi:hypothetical protein